MSETILLSKATPVTGRGNLRAFVDLQIGEIRVNCCRVIQQPGQKAYVTGPQIQSGDAYFPAVCLPRRLKEQIEFTVLNDPTIKQHLSR